MPRDGALLTAAVVPFGSELNLEWLSRFGVSGDRLQKPVKLVIADLSVGPLYTFAIASLGVYGIVLAGWASNSKYPFLGGVRSSSQMISYEIALGLSIIPVLMIFGDLNLSKIAQYQDANGWLLLPLWGKGLTIGRWVLLVPVAISFVVFTISMFAETNRAPFDLPECETELVAGYHTEYSSMKFALFFMGEYATMIVGSGLMVTLFLGGWSIPFRQVSTSRPAHAFWLGLLHIGFFLAKVWVSSSSSSGCAGCCRASVTTSSWIWAGGVYCARARQHRPHGGDPHVVPNLHGHDHRSTPHPEMGAGSSARS